MGPKRIAAVKRGKHSVATHFSLLNSPFQDIASLTITQKKSQYNNATTVYHFSWHMINEETVSAHITIKGIIHKSVSLTFYRPDGGNT